MSVRTRILIPMIALTVIGCSAVFISSMFLYRREVNVALNNKIELAASIVVNEIEDLKLKSRVAAFGMANNPELAAAIATGDRAHILSTANNLRYMTQIDFCNIVDRDGYVIVRTHAPNLHSDDISNQPHVRRAMEGYSETFITQGSVIQLGIYSGAPVYNSDMDMVGLISLGFRLDVQEFAFRLSDLTGCDITVFYGDTRISTTLYDREGLYAIGTKAPKQISEQVLSGDIYSGYLNLFGNNLLTKYIPLHSEGGNIIGMIFVGYNTVEEDNKTTTFIIIALLITFIVLLACLALALPVSGFVKNQLEQLMIKADRTQKEAHENMRQALITAETASKSKSVFLANMSHEIRTPMNSILGFSELAQDDEDIPVKTRKYLSNISDNATWLLGIINDILDNTKIESGKISIESIPFNLQEVISQCQAAIQPKTVDKGFSLYCYTEPIKGKKVVGDPVRLRQVLMNLLSNAVKFTSVGSVKLLAQIMDISDTQAVVRFEVNDTGIGMDPEEIEFIFDPYVQADDSHTRKFGGTGLGLPISKSIVKLMGSDLTVNSIPGVGSTFSFVMTFDLIDDQPGEMPNKQTGEQVKKPYFDAEILVCEDNFLNQQVICDHLSRVGIRTTVAHNGKEGIDAVLKRKKDGDNHFDLIFMDIHMPVMDGLEASYQISAIDLDVPIVALTANIMANDVELYRKAGMLDVLGKPFTSQDLWKCLSKYLPVVDYIIEDKAVVDEHEDKALAQLCVYFYNSNQTTYDKIMEAVDSNDIRLAHRLTHTLKSNAGQIGENILQKTAAEAELILAKGSLQLGDALTHMLRDELDLVLKRLAPLAEKVNNKDVQLTNDNDKIQEILSKLEPKLKRHNTDCINMIDEIRTIPGAEKLAQFVDDFEFKQAIAELSIIKERINVSNE